MRERISKNQRGSSLPVAILVCMLLAIGLMALQTSVMSFAQRTSVKHHEMQAYLSARNVATELAKMLEEETDAYILTYGIDERNQFTNFPTDLKDLPEVAADRPAGMVSWIHGLMDMEVNDVKNFENFTWNRENVPADFDLGDISATIKRTDEKEFEVAATCTVEGNKETVKVLLSCTEFEKEGTKKPEVVPESEPGNANMIFSDYGFGVKAGDGIYNKLLNNNEVMPFISSIPIYLSDNKGDLHDKVESYGDIYVDKFGGYGNRGSKTNGAFVTRQNLYIANQTITNAFLHAEERITLGSNVSIDTNSKKYIYAKTLYLHGNDIKIGPSEIYAERVIFDGTNIKIDGNIFAGEVQFVDGCSNGYNNTLEIATLTGKAYWVSEPHLDGISQELIDDSEDDSDNVKDQIKVLDGLSNIVFNNVSVKKWENEQLNLPATQVAPRYKPDWADVSDMDTAIPLDDVKKVANGGWANEGVNVGDGEQYYVISADSDWNNEKFDFSAYYNGNNSANDKWGEGNNEYPMIFVVEDGATFWISNHCVDSSKTIYVILQGNANLKISGKQFLKLRVYADRTTTKSEHEAILTDINTIVQDIQDDYGYSGGEAQKEMIAAIENAIRAKMIAMDSKLPMIVLENNAMLYGTCVVPYIYSEGDGVEIWGGRYPSGFVTGDDSLSEDDSQLPEIGEVVSDPIKMMHVDIHTYSE